MQKKMVQSWLSPLPTFGPFVPYSLCSQIFHVLGEMTKCQLAPEKFVLIDDVS